MSDLITAKLQPFAILSHENQLFIAENSEPRPIEAGETVFSAGDPARNSYYLLKGKAKLINAKGKEISRGPSGLPLSQGYESFSLSCIAEEKSLVLQVNLSPKEQEKILCWELASKFVSDADWVQSVKSCEMFDFIATGNLLRLIQGFQKKEACAGDTITTENKFEKEFYVLTEGRAEVFQGKIDENSKPFSEISKGQTFGEASLMEDLPRTATIKMAEDGELMALDAAHLEPLKSETIPMSTFKDSAGLKEAVANGSKILDIRTRKEAQLSPIKGAVLAPIDNFPESVASAPLSESLIIYSAFPELNKLVYHFISEENDQIFVYRQ